MNQRKITKSLKGISKYDLVKIVIYLLGFIFSVYSILKHGLIDSHTPPVGFVVPFLLMLIAIIWYIVDLILIKFLEYLKISKAVNLCGLMINFLIVFLILIGKL